jgi:inner membrane protein
MHLLQYGMVGLSLSLFYLTLLSLAEHIDFRWAFTAAAAVTICMNSLYVASVLNSKMHGLVMAALLAGLYTLLFSLLKMEDFSLLAGTILVVIMMGVLMFFTRRLSPVPVVQ